MRRKRNQTDFQAEIQAHVQLEADQLQADGLNPKEAEMPARSAFGNRAAAEERFYEAGRCLWWDHPVRVFHCFSPFLEIPYDARARTACHYEPSGGRIDLEESE